MIYKIIYKNSIKIIYKIGIKFIYKMYKYSVKIIKLM